MFYIERMVQLDEDKKLFDSLMYKMTSRTTDEESLKLLSSLHMYNVKIAKDSNDLGFLEGTLNELSKMLPSTSSNTHGGSRRSRNKKMRGTRRR
jgi:hypothetical protein